MLTIRNPSEYSEGYYREVPRYFPIKPGKEWHEVGYGFYRKSFLGTVMVRKLWKKASRARNAPLVHADWEVLDISAVSSKTWLLGSDYYEYLEPLKQDVECVRHCDNCGQEAPAGGYHHEPRRVIELSIPPEIMAMSNSVGGSVTAPEYARRHWLCASCAPAGTERCHRCGCWHETLFAQKAMADLAEWAQQALDKALPYGYANIGGALIAHPGDSVRPLLNALTGGLLCWPRERRLIEEVDRNLRELRAIKAWHLGEEIPKNQEFLSWETGAIQGTETKPPTPEPRAERDAPARAPFIPAWKKKLIEKGQV